MKTYANRSELAEAAGLSPDDVRRILRRCTRMKRGRIQAAYSIMRDGVPCIVPTRLMTVAELRAKARADRAMALGLCGHADELEQLADACEATEKP
jgi:hypothetical protein